MARILTEDSFGINNARIMRICNFNCKQIEVYTQILLENNLLDKEIDDNGQVKFIATQLGRDFIKDFHLLQVQLDSHDSECS